MQNLVKLLTAALLLSGCDFQRTGDEAGAGEPDVEYLEFGDGTDLPFSRAVRYGDIVFLSGDLGARPGEMQVVPGGIEAETRQTMENIRATLGEFGGDLSDIVKCTVFLADIEEWPAFNAVYADYFDRPMPARAAFAASGLALGARVELDCIAVLRD